MEIALLGQPFGQATQLGADLRASLVDPEFSRLRVAVAWAKQSGLARIANALRTFRTNGGQAELIVGVDEGGATREGLGLALELFTTVHVFHDPGTRTYHPKLYCLVSPQSALLYVGSSNLTRGGLFTNYESGLLVRLDLELDADAGLLRSFDEYYESLLKIGPAAQPLTEDLLEQLVSDPRFRIRPERRPREAQGRDGTHGAGVFGAPVAGLAGAPTPDISVDEEVELDAPMVASDAKPAEAAVDEPAARDSRAGHPRAITGFWKRLSDFDVSRTSAPGQMIIPIGFLSFFEPMVLQVDETGSGGVRQSERYMTCTFKDGEYTKTVPDARAILYEPARHHPRPNRELRFTFHDRDILERLHAREVLVFRRERDGETVLIERLAPGSMGPGRFGAL